MESNGNPFNDLWIECLKEHFKKLVAEDRNVSGGEAVLEMIGVGQEEIQLLKILATKNEESTHFIKGV